MKKTISILLIVLGLFLTILVIKSNVDLIAGCMIIVIGYIVSGIGIYLLYDDDDDFEY